MLIKPCLKISAFAILIFLFLGLSVRAAKVDTIITHSDVMHKDIKAVVIRPAEYGAGKKLPVLYLLHGAGGNYSDWVTKTPDKTVVSRLADAYGIIIVLPDGGVTSWYFDSPVDPSYQYETYVSKELVTYIDAHYQTIKNKSGRAITGLSMGGHGGLYLGFRHQDIFGACGSMSGGVDIRSFPLNWDIAKRLGSYAQFPERWENNTVINQLHLLTPNNLAIIIDCGTGDFFYNVNQKLHEKLLERNINHDYITRPGVHNFEYWGNAIQYQMLFFNNFFNRPKA